MKLSEKYLEKYKISPQGTPDYAFSKVNYPDVKTYGEICALEAQQTLLVSNPETFPQEKYIDKLAHIVNALEEIAVREQL